MLLEQDEINKNRCKNCCRTWERRAGSRRRHFCCPDCRIEYHQNKQKELINLFHAKLANLETRLTSIEKESIK